MVSNATIPDISNNTPASECDDSRRVRKYEVAETSTENWRMERLPLRINRAEEKTVVYRSERTGAGIIYKERRELSSEELENELPMAMRIPGGIHRDDEKQWMVKQVDYENSDGKECSAFIVTKTEQIAPQITGLARRTMRCDCADSGAHQPVA